LAGVPEQSVSVMLSQFFVGAQSRQAERISLLKASALQLSASRILPYPGMTQTPQLVLLTDEEFKA